MVSKRRTLLFTMIMTPDERADLDKLARHRKLRHASELVRQLLSEEAHHQKRLDDELRECHKPAESRRTVRP
jgi:hypothetical protein